MTQYDLSPCSLTWGSLKIVLIVSVDIIYDLLLRGRLTISLQTAQSYTRFFESLTRMLSRMGDTVSIYSRYERLVEQRAFRAVLSDVYTDILAFLVKARSLLQTNCIHSVRFDSTYYR